jgi:hypothetical protein
MVLKEFNIFPAKRQGFYFRVFIHNSLSSLRDEWDRLPKNVVPHASGKVKAFTVSYTPAEKKMLGEVHLVKNSPMPIIVHELTHCAVHYFLIKKYDIAGSDEPLCYAVQFLLQSYLQQLEISPKV